MHVTHGLALLMLANAVFGWRQDSDSKRLYDSYLGKPVPVLTGGKEDWLNVREAPNLEGLKGRAVLVVFTSLF